ncbi:hypothetical protein [Streptomyces malaysiensis]|uniref:hypothetical protein n=1 Tax=Streptomyces malaysiensis TaxID=92644 RepID=UPI0037191DF3
MPIALTAYRPASAAADGSETVLDTLGHHAARNVPVVVKEILVTDDAVALTARTVAREALW